MNQRIEGAVERVVFYNDENGYAVVSVKGEAGRQVTAVGTLPGVRTGQRLRLTGRWVVHSRYGRQFAVERYEQALPETAQGIRAYLASDLIAGVGPVNAAHIVRRFGGDTLRVLDEEPGRLQEVPGIGPGRAAAIAASWQEHRDVSQTMMWLQSRGITAGLAMKLHQTYGRDTIQVVQHRPYCLIDDVWGVGFQKADRVAREVGITPDDPRRLRAGVIHVLKQESQDGHVYTPLDAVVTSATALLSAAHDDVKAAIEDLHTGGQVCYDALDDALDGAQQIAVYLASYHEAEVGVARCLHRLARTPPTRPIAWRAEMLQANDENGGLDLSPEQRAAVKAAITGKVTALTGGPGTGKTQTVRAVVRVLEQAQGCSGGFKADVDYALCAPTGRAAKRLSEACDRPAQTVHRLLGYNPTQGFARDFDRPLPVRFLIVDEASMLDLQLTYRLLQALRPSTQVLFVGDVNQLPSVGAGTVLDDLIASNLVPVTRLTQIFRQAEDSGIVVNAHRINRGQAPVLNGYDDFYFFGQSDPEAAADMLVDVVKRRIPRKFGLAPIDDLQVLAPMYRGACGVDALNERLQAVLNPPNPGKAERKVGKRVFRVGDRVMQTRNDYAKEVFNGDVGRVTGIETQGLWVTMDGERAVPYRWSETGDLKHAFATSIHKAQGSEYPGVVVPMTTQHYLMLRRNLFYTAVTRAKQLAVLVGTRRAVHIAINNDDVPLRRSGLRARL